MVLYTGYTYLCWWLGAQKMYDILALIKIRCANDDRPVFWMRYSNRKFENDLLININYMKFFDYSSTIYKKKMGTGIKTYYCKNQYIYCFSQHLKYQSNKCTNNFPKKYELTHNLLCLYIILLYYISFIFVYNLIICIFYF